MKKVFPILALYLIIFQALVSCGIYKPVDAKKYPPQPELRVKNNIEEGRGFRLMTGFGNNGKSGKFEFANANPLWRASLDIIDFMPLLSVDYGGGIIITDWYGEENENDAIKITIQFLSNEVRSDALNIKVFYKKCALNENCAISEKTGKLVNELNKKILQKAAVYQKQIKVKNFKPYDVPGVTK